MSESRLRLISQLKSSIFPTSETYSIQYRPSKKMTRDSHDTNSSYGCQRSQTPTTNSYLKPIDHSSIDFFGQSYSNYPKNHSSTPKSTFIKSKQFFTLDKISNQHSASTHNNSSTTKLQTLTNPITLSTNLITQSSNSSIKSKHPKLQDPTVESISISGLKTSDNDTTLKQLCKGLHIIQINTSIDNLTGSCLGNATLQIRAGNDKKDLERLKSKILNNGYKISAVASARGKKNQVCNLGTDFLDLRLQNKEKVFPSVKLSSRERKIAILSTSDDLFGNTPGTGKWCSGQESRVNLKEARENRENLRIWDITRQVGDHSPRRCVTNQSNYSRGILSSRNK
ncbi:hypothetical protein SteCoe_19510 [Stentor coeruleus]|uniref:Uncharacterized protein n=1 Tax=Stentor coeruleus TaxID=5963 RepID=A0A1R2BTW4_9CILI|nr:hypothetical protein SteCoe_19510 [Stentor coeruleus]